MTEAGLLDQIEVISCNPDSTNFQEIAETLRLATGKKPSYPTVEVRPGEFMADSDALIEHFAGQHGVDAENLPTLAYYKQGLFELVLRLWNENQQLKASIC